MSKIIVPPVIAPDFDLTLIIKFNTRNGATQMQVRNSGIKPINSLQLAGILSEHCTGLLRQIVSGSLKLEPMEDKEGSTNG